MKYGEGTNGNGNCLNLSSSKLSSNPPLQQHSSLSARFLDESTHIEGSTHESPSGSSDEENQCTQFPPDTNSTSTYAPFTLSSYSLTYRTCTKNYLVKTPINVTNSSTPEEVFDRKLYVYFMLCPEESCGEEDGWKVNCGVYVIGLEEARARASER